MSTQHQVLGATRSASHWLLPAVLLSGFVGALYAPVLARLVGQWWNDPDYSHGFLVPIFVGYLLWQTRSRLQQLPIAPSNFGMLVMLFAVALLLAGTLGAELFVSRFSLLVLLAGMVLYLAGTKVLKALAFPLGYLALMIPLPAIIYYQITFPLQLLASRLASSWLEVLQVPVLREGNLLILPNYTLEVVEACSGVRSLMSLVSLTIAYAYVMERRAWVRTVLVAFVLPLAIAENALRVVVAGLLTYFSGPESAEGFLHFFSGWLFFLAAVVLILPVHWLLGRVGRSRRETTFE